MIPEAAITARRLLLVEGRDELEFFDALVRQEKLEGVQVMIVGGKAKFPKKLVALQRDRDFGGVEALAVVRDADENAASAFQSATGLLQRSGLPVPREMGTFTEGDGLRVGIYVMPGGQESGMLEDLCLQTVADHPVATCVDEYVACLEERLAPQGAAGQPALPRNLSKCRAYAFLAAMEEPVARVGIGAQKGYWKLDHPALESLRSFLAQLAA